MAGSTLRFEVVVNANEADKVLQATAAAFNQVGVSARLALKEVGAASKQAGAEVTTLGGRMKSFAREQRAEARTANFFVQELAQIVPVSQSAGLALSALGQAMVGGLGVVAAIQLTVAAVKLLSDAWRDADKAARDALDAGAKRLDKLDAQLEKQRNRNRTDAEEARDQRRLVVDQIESLQAALPAVRARINSEMRGISGKTESQKLAEAMEAQLSILAREKERLELVVQESIKAADAAEAERRSRAATVELVANQAEIISSTASGTGFYTFKNPDVPVTILPPEYADIMKYQDVTINKQKSITDELKDSERATQEWALALGTAVGRLASGKGEAEEMLKTLLIMFAQMAAMKIFGPTGGTFAAAFIGGIGGRAAGGPVSYGMPVIVGERGPELFVPPSSGTIVPNHAMAGASTYNIFAMDGRSVERVLTDADGKVARAERKRARRRRN